MNQIDTLDHIFDFVDEIQFFRVICKLWCEVIDYKLRRGNYVESEWIRTHLRFLKLKKNIGFSKGKPRGSCKAESVDIKLGITYQLFSFQDYEMGSTIIELVCSDYLGFRLKLPLPPLELFISSDLFYRIVKIGETNDLYIQIGDLFKSNFKFDFESFTLCKTKDSFVSNAGRRYLSETQLIVFNSDKDIISFKFNDPVDVNNKVEYNLELHRKEGNLFKVIIFLENSGLFFVPTDVPLMAHNIGDNNLLLFHDYYLALKTTEPVQLQKVDLHPLISSLQKCKDLFILNCPQRQKFVIGHTKQTNRPSNLKQLYLNKII